ncbi:MAG TPA: substrate-binding domain-containing protein [Atribacteraceae bacterium]|nr:substrate-binding domain-containing protein [Atribacteraceae bacterium]
MKRKLLPLGLSLLLVVAFILTGSALAAEEEPVAIHFFAGGPPGCIFATVVERGAMAAAEILGPRVKVTTWWSDWLAEKMITQFQEAMAMRPDGIVVYGVPGDDAFEPFIDEAKELGIIVTTINTTLPKLEARYKLDGFGWIGADLYGSGYQLGEATVKHAGLVEGDRVFVWGMLGYGPIRGLRSRGVIDAFEEAGLVVDYLEVSDEVNVDPALGIPVAAGHLLANPDTKVIVTDHGGMTAVLEDYIKAADLGPEDIFGAGFDLSPAIVRAIRGGYTDLVLDQQPFLHGFLSIFQIYLSHHYDFTGLHVDTGAGLIHAGNIEEVAALAEAGIR